MSVGKRRINAPAIGRSPIWVRVAAEHFGLLPARAIMAQPQLCAGKTKAASHAGKRVMLIGIADFCLMPDGLVGQIVFADGSKADSGFYIFVA